MGDEDQFDRLFEEFRDEAFRLETLPGYNVGADAERLEQFASGAYLPEEPIPGVGFVRELVEPGRRTSLVRLIADPPTLDQRLSFDWVYPHHAAAGRAISILEPGSALADEAGVASDFWLFDSTAVALMSYGAAGGFEGVDILADPGEVSLYVDLRQRLLSGAKPFQEWLASWRQRVL